MNCLEKTSGRYVARLKIRIPMGPARHNVPTKPDKTAHPKSSTDDLDALLDTGSEISLVDEDEAKSRGYAIGASDSSASSVTGHSLTITGQVSLPTKLGGKLTTCHKFYTAKNLPHPVLLGYDFVYEQLATITIDTRRQRLYVLPHGHPPGGEGWVSIGAYQPDPPVHATDNLVVPPRTALIALISVPCATNFITYRFNAVTRLEQTIGISIADALVSPRKHEVPVLFTNASSSPKTVYKGTRLGSLTYTGVIEKGISVPINRINTKSTKEQSAEEQAEPKLACSLKKDLPSLAPESNLPEELSGLDLSDAEATEKEKLELIQDLTEFKEIFAVPGNDLGCIPHIEHEIPTGDTPPVRTKPYRTPFNLQAEIERQTQELLGAGVIQESTSPYASPVIIVPKKDGEARMCIDFRKLNALTLAPQWPLPNITEIIDSLHKSKYFCTLDVKAGFWHVKVAEKDVPKTAFCTTSGQFEWLRMPFGLKGAPATFQRAMQHVMAGLEPETMILYMDDILVHAETFDGMRKKLRTVFMRLRAYNIRLKISKCKFALSKVNYLGHTISADGIEPDKSKVEVIANFERPTDVTGVRRFLGMTGYYRRFIPGFAAIAVPLFELMRHNAPFHWSDRAQHAVDVLKAKLINPPILQYPDFSQPFILETDASGTAIGCVLLQERSGKRMPIAYASRVLDKHERNYTATETEGLAVYYGLKHFRHYIYGQKTIVYTDHSALREIISIKEPSGRLARWQMALQDKNIEIHHQPGKNNVKADFLSRLPLTAAIVQEELLHDIITAQRTDPLYGAIYEFLTSGKLNPDLSVDIKKQAEKSSQQFKLDNGYLFFKDQSGYLRTVVPSSLRSALLEAYHANKLSGHLGQVKTEAKLKTKYWWPRMHQDVENTVKHCAACQAAKNPSPKHKPPIHPIKVSRPWQLVEMDFMELPMTYNGNRYVLVFQDHFSKWIEAVATPDQKAERVARLFVEQIVCRCGAPERLNSDAAKNFLSAVVKEICRLTTTKKTTATPYSPTTDGLVERTNRSLQGILRTYVETSQRNWDDYLPYAVFSLNTAIHTTTGFSPHFLLLGTEPMLPIDRAFQYKPSPYILPEDLPYVEALQYNLTLARQAALDHTRKRQDKTMGNPTAKSPQYKVGDKVLKWTAIPEPTKQPQKAAKLTQHWTGPFLITHVFDNNTVTILDWEQPEKDPIRVNLKKLKPFYEPPP